MDNKIMRNSLGEMLIESEYSLENEFLKALAAGDGSEEDLGGEVSARTSPDAPDTPLQEADAIRNTLDDNINPDNALMESETWKDFAVQRSDALAGKLADPEQQGLEQKDADENSFYIEYTNPETGKKMGVMGPMFGMNREQGDGQGWIGGYQTESETKEDFHKLKTTWPDGLPEDREYLLVEIADLSPDLVVYQKQKQKQLPELVDKQEEEAVKADEEEIPEVPEMEVTETPEAQAKPSQTTPQPSLPKPVKKVPAFLMDIRLIRESSIQRLKNIKGY